MRRSPDAVFVHFLSPSSLSVSSPTSCIDHISTRARTFSNSGNILRGRIVHSSRGEYARTSHTHWQCTHTASLTFLIVGLALLIHRALASYTGVTVLSQFRTIAHAMFPIAAASPISGSGDIEKPATSSLSRALGIAGVGVFIFFSALCLPSHLDRHACP